MNVSPNLLNIMFNSFSASNRKNCSSLMVIMFLISAVVSASNLE